MVGLVRVVRFVIVGKGFGGWQGGRVLNTVNRPGGLGGAKGKPAAGRWLAVAGIVFVFRHATQGVGGWVCRCCPVVWAGNGKPV